MARDIPKDVIDRVPAQMATSYKIVPVEFDPKNGGTLKVVVSSPENIRAVDDLRTFLGINVVAAIADPDADQQACSPNITTPSRNRS